MHDMQMQDEGYGTGPLGSSLGDPGTGSRYNTQMMDDDGYGGYGQQGQRMRSKSSTGQPYGSTGAGTGYGVGANRIQHPHGHMTPPQHSFHGMSGNRGQQGVVGQGGQGQYYNRSESVPIGSEFVPIQGSQSQAHSRSLDRRDPYYGMMGSSQQQQQMSDPNYNYYNTDPNYMGTGQSAGMRSNPGARPGIMKAGQTGQYGQGQVGVGAGQAGQADMYLSELQWQNSDFQRELQNLKKELELTNQKLGSSMHSIKTFWSPELKKERALRKEESARYNLITDQFKILSQENQRQALLVRQLEEELRIRIARGGNTSHGNTELQRNMEILINENEHLVREIRILRETIKELELRLETQRATVLARDDSIKKLLEIIQTKGLGSGPGSNINIQKLEEEFRQQIQQIQFIAGKQIDELRLELSKKDQESNSMTTKMKTLEEQQTDYQRHIAVLKESLCAKDEQGVMLQGDIEELRQRLEEKNRIIEKKSQAALQASQERNRLASEFNEIRDQMEIKERKISVLQRKIENLEDLLREKDVQVDMARARLQQFSNMGLPVQQGGQGQAGQVVGGPATGYMGPGAQQQLGIGAVQQGLHQHQQVHQHQIHDPGQLQLQQSGASVLNNNLISNLEEAIQDKEKQINQLREQRDRAEAERLEERELHERDVGETKIKIRSIESELEKIHVRYDRVISEKERLETKLEQSQSELGKSKAELEKTYYEFGKNQNEFDNLRSKITKIELENERLKTSIISNVTSGDMKLNMAGGQQQQQQQQQNQQGQCSGQWQPGGGSSSSNINPYKISNILSDNNNMKNPSSGLNINSPTGQVGSPAQQNNNMDSNQSITKLNQDFRRSQAELRLTQSDLEKSKLEIEELNEKLEKSTGEIYRLKAKLENSLSEKETLHEESERNQLIQLRLHSDKEKLTQEIEKLREELERLNTNLMKEKMLNDKGQLAYDKLTEEYDKLQEKYEKLTLEYRRIMGEKEKFTYEMNSLREFNEKSIEKLTRFSKEKENLTLELELIREKYEKLNINYNRINNEKENLTADYNGLNEKSDYIFAQNNKLKLENSELKCRLEEIQQEFKCKNFDDLKNVKFEIERRLSEDKQKSNFDLNSLKIEKDNITKNKEKLQQDLFKIQMVLEEKITEVEKLNKLNYDLVNELKECKELSEMSLNRAKENEEKLRKEKEKIKNEFEILREKHEHEKLYTEKIVNERSQMQSEIDRLQSSKNGGGFGSEKDLQMIQEMRMNLEQKGIEIEHLKNLNEKLQSEVNSNKDFYSLKYQEEMKNLNEETKGREQELIKMLKQKSEQFDSLSKELNEKVTELNRYRSGSDEKVGEINKLKAELDNLQHGKLREYEKIKEKFDRSKGQLDKYEKQFSKYEMEMMQLTSERDELINQLEKSQELLVQFQKELNQRAEQVKSEGGEREQELNRLKGKLTEYETEFQRMKKQYEKDFQRLKEMIRVQEEKAKQLEKQAKDKETRLEAQIQQLLSDLEAKEQTNTRSQSEQTQKIQSDYESQINQLRHQLTEQAQNLRSQYESDYKQMMQTEIDRVMKSNNEHFTANLNQQLADQARNFDKIVQDERGRAQGETEQFYKKELDQLHQLVEKERVKSEELEKFFIELQDENTKLKVKMNSTASAQGANQDQINEYRGRIQELESKLKKMSEDMRLMSQSQGQAGQADALIKKLNAELQQRENEMERLLDLVKMTQEEQNAKDKHIRDLQESLRQAQGHQQQQQRQMQQQPPPQQQQQQQQRPPQQQQQHQQQQGPSTSAAGQQPGGPQQPPQQQQQQQPGPGGQPVSPGHQQQQPGGPPPDQPTGPQLPGQKFLGDTLSGLSSNITANIPANLSGIGSQMDQGSKQVAGFLKSLF